MTPSERRERLVEWMRFVAVPVTVADVMEKCAAYELVHPHRFDLPRRDLAILVEQHKIRRLPGRPARWEVVR